LAYLLIFILILISIIIGSYLGGLVSKYLKSRKKINNNIFKEATSKKIKR